jgi:hypothetical protein
MDFRLPNVWKRWYIKTCAIFGIEYGVFDLADPLATHTSCVCFFFGLGNAMNYIHGWGVVVVVFVVFFSFSCISRSFLTLSQHRIFALPLVAVAFVLHV